MQEQFSGLRSEIYRLKGKVLQKMIADGYAKISQPVTLWKHRFLLVKLGNRNTYHLPVETNFPVAMDAKEAENSYCWYPKREKREAFYKYSLEEVVINLTAYINNEYEVIPDEKPVKKKKETKINTGPTILSATKKKKKKKRRKKKKKLPDKRSLPHIPVQENFDPLETDILLQSIALIGERTIRKYIRREQPHPQRLFCIGEAVRILGVLANEGAVFHGQQGFYRVGDLVFDCLYYGDLPFGRILLPLAPPIPEDDFNDGYCIAELGKNQYYGGLGKKTAASYIYAAGRYYNQNTTT